MTGFINTDRFRNMHQQRLVELLSRKGRYVNFNFNVNSSSEIPLEVKWCQQVMNKWTEFHDDRFVRYIEAGVVLTASKVEGVYKAKQALQFLNFARTYIVYQNTPKKPTKESSIILWIPKRLWRYSITEPVNV